MKNICPNCEKVTICEEHNNKEIYQIKGEDVSVDVKFFTCGECNEEFEKVEDGEDYLEVAYRKYRQMNEMMQPEDIVSFRKAYNLTQKELSGLLGWGGATLSRYENGALQDSTHDRMLKLITKPENLLDLVKTQSRLLDPNKKEKLLKTLEAQTEDSCTIKSIISNSLADHRPSLLSGFRKFDLNKFTKTIQFFSKEKVFKSKLCKLLFYNDFKHYKDNSISITGSQYAHGFHGPIPDKFEIFFASLIDENKILAEEKIYHNYSGELYFWENDVDLSDFSNEEKETLIFIKKYFQDFTAKGIRAFSHKEKGYTETSDGEIITYDYANDLLI